MRRYPDYKYRPKKKAKELAAAAAVVTSQQQQQQLPQENDTKIPLNGKNNGVLKLDYQSKPQIIKTIKPQPIHNILRKVENTKLVTIASKNGQCLMPSGKPFLTLSRQVGKIGSLSSSDGNFSLSPQKTILPKTTLNQQMFRANPLTPPPNVPESLTSTVDGESNLSFYEDIELIDCKKSNLITDIQTAPVWTSEGSDCSDNLPVSPLSDIPDLYTTPEVSELLSSGQWLDGSLGF